MSQSTILLGSGSQVLLQIQSEGNEELKSKGRKGGTGLGQVNEKVFSLAKLLREGPAFGSGVNVCSFLQSFTGGQGQIISLRAEQRHFSLQSGGGSMSSEAGYYE